MGTSEATLSAASPRSSHKTSASVARQAAGSRRSPGRVAITIFWILLWIVPVATVLIWGLEYYLTSIPERAHSGLHDLMKPSGMIGLGLGIVGTILIVLGVGMYSLRKRVRFLGRLSELGIWLQLHIYICTLGPVLILFHTSFKFGGIVSIGFWCMVIVTVTGFFGRYLSAHIPSTIHGQVKSLESLRAEQKELVETIRADFGAQSKEIEQVLITGPRRRPRGFLHALVLMTGHALSKRRRLRKINELLSHEGSSVSRGANGAQREEQPVYLRESLIGVVRGQLELEQQIVLLEPFQTVFKFWHIMHTQLTIVMLVIVAGHIGVAILFGHTWIF